MCFSRNVSINITFRSIEEVTPFNLIQHYFSRNPDSELHFPHCICGPIVQRELKYWNISDDRIASCCWKFYRYFSKVFVSVHLKIEQKSFANCYKIAGKSISVKYFIHDMEREFHNFADNGDLNSLKLCTNFAGNSKMNKKRWMS